MLRAVLVLLLLSWTPLADARPADCVNQLTGGCTTYTWVYWPSAGDGENPWGRTDTYCPDEGGDMVFVSRTYGLYGGCPGRTIG